MDQQSGSGQWQRRPDTSFAPLRSPRAGNNALSVDAPVFVPKKTLSPQQGSSGQQGYHQQRHRADNNGSSSSGGGGGGGGGGGPYGMVPSMVPPHFAQQHELNGGAMLNGTEMIGKSTLSDRLKNLQTTGHGQAPQMGGHHNYGGDKDMRNSSHYNHHQQQHHPNQHFPQQHSQQQRLQHQQQQQQHQQQLSGMHQGAYPFPLATGMGYSSTALNNHLHHPILGGMAVTGPGMMAHDNRGGGGGGGKNNSAVRNRLQNAQNAQMHHHHQQQQQHHQQQQHQHLEQRMRRLGVKDNDHHHNHHHHSMGGGNDFGADGDAEQITESETMALDYLTEVIAELYDNPGMFENIQRKLKGTFVEFRGNNFVMSNAIEMIFEQSIKEQNFRYMGARLCHLLDCLDDSPESVLRQLLGMKMAHQENELPGYLQHEQIKVRGTTLFLAELYMQLRKPHDTRNGEIAMRITNAAKILLSREGPENIKCVCQCLKLCGFELERDRRDDLMYILGTLESKEGSIDCSTGRFIRSVIELQQKSWGRSEEVVPPPQQPVTDAGNCEEFDSPVFYGPDGQVMTEEENDFLEMAAPVTFEEFDDGEDPDELVDDENMDMEIKMAFKDFVAHSKNRQPY